jgi:hypothetical protein
LSSILSTRFWWRKRFDIMSNIPSKLIDSPAVGQAWFQHWFIEMDFDVGKFFGVCQHFGMKAGLASTVRDDSWWRTA